MEHIAYVYKAYNKMLHEKRCSKMLRLNLMNAVNMCDAMLCKCLFYMFITYLHCLMI